MPYISPSLSPTKTFASPTSSGASSPKRQGSYSGSTTPSTSYIDGFPSSPYEGSAILSLPTTTSTTTTSSSIPSHMKRPPHRHHSRSHSSDTLVTMSSTSSSLSSSASSNTSSSTLYHPSSRPPIYNRHSKSSKMTPDYIFVQPASPGPDEMPPKTSSSTVVTTNGHASAPQDASNGYYHSMPSSSARHYSYSHSPSSSSSPPSSSRPSLRRSSYTRQSASAVFDQHQNHHAYSYGSTTSAGDDGDVPPPRSSSHSNLSQASANATSHRRSNRRGMSASADSSPRHSISISPLPRINDDEQQVPMRSDNTVSAPVTPAHARFAMSSKKGDIEDSKAPRSHSMQTSFSDSALATSSSSADSSFNNSSESESESKASRAALSSPLLQKHKPSWGEIPTPTSMNSSTAFSFGQQKSNPSTSSSMDVTTPTALTNGASDQAGRAEIGSGSSTPTPKAEMEDPVALKKTNTAQPSTNINGALSSGLVAETDSRSSSPSSGSGSGSSATPTSGPLAPAATTVKRRPHHMKAFSERSESPFRLEFESNNSNNNSQAREPSTHSRMTGLRYREASEGSNTSENGGAAPALAPHFAHGGLTVHTHHPIPHFKGEGGGAISASVHHGHGPRSSSYRPSPLPTPMLRKKSGELVKSSMKHDSRAKSAPTTPTGPKAVHFDEQLERVKLFLAQQKPTAVSRDGSPVETETEDDSEANAFPFPPMTTSIPAQITLVLPDFHKNMLPDLGSRDVCLESLEIAADSKSLKGTSLLRNLAFEKRLSVRFTFDDWQTVSEVTGEWQATLNGGQIDRWSFRIKLDDMLARIEDKKLYLALKYQVAGQEIWDSNNGQNYKAEFKKQAARSQAVVGGSRAARHEWAVTNAGQANERMADLRRELDRLVAGHEDDDFSSADELVISSANGGNKGFKYQHRFLGGEAVPLAQAPASNTFSSRYDFGASLKQAATGGNASPANASSTINLAPPLANAALAQQQVQLLPASSTAKANGSPQNSHAILDNPYFAAPNASEAMINSWRNAASIHQPASQHTAASTLSPAPSPLAVNTNDIISPKSQHQRLYADDDAPLLMSTSVIGGMPATTFVPAEPSATTPPASFSGSSYYPRTEADGVISQDFGLPNLMSYMNIGAGTGHARERSNSNASSPRTEVPSSASSTASTATPGSYFPAGDPISSSTNSSASNSTVPSVEHSPTTDFSGGAPLARQARLASMPPPRSFLRDVENASLNGHFQPGESFRPTGRLVNGNGNGYSDGTNGHGTAASTNNNKLGMFLHHGQRQHSGSSLAEMLDASLMDSSIDPRDTSIYSPAISPRSVSPPISSSAEIPGVHQRRHSPPPRPISPDDLLSPSPSSASTDTSISTPQSPGGSPPLRMYSPFIASANSGGGRPEMGSDTYFNFVHRYCWGNGDPTSSSSSSSSTSTALGLAGLNPAYELPTPRRITPPSSCSASLLSSPTQSQSGSRTPSPKNGSPSLDSVQRMEAKGYMSGPPPVHI